MTAARAPYFSTSDRHFMELKIYPCHQEGKYTFNTYVKMLKMWHILVDILLLYNSGYFY